MPPGVPLGIHPEVPYSISLEVPPRFLSSVTREVLGVPPSISLGLGILLEFF